MAKGYNQCEWIDYYETFSHVAKLTAIKVLLATAVAKGWYLLQLDVNYAFLHAWYLNEEVCMTLPQGFASKGENRVCKLQKSLYGLKQASWPWFSKFSFTLIKHGFIIKIVLFTLYSFARNLLYCLALNVNDIILASNDETTIFDLAVSLNSQFRLKNVGSVKFFLGLENAWSKKGISLCQRKYTLEILEDSGYLVAKPVSFPIDSNLKLSRDEG